MFNDYAVCGQSISAYDFIAGKIISINNDRSTISKLTAEKTKKYNDVKSRQKQFSQDVERLLKITHGSVVFDDAKCEISINLDRDFRSYSTGERHILFFLYQIYSFLGSDSPVLVLDDLASSLDLINLYKIAFEIVRNCAVPNKSLLVFTHSVELVNAINSQKNGFLSVYYIEELNGTMYCDKVCYEGKGVDNVFSLEHLEGFRPKLVKSLKRRDDEQDDNEHKVYHFDPSGVSAKSADDDSLTNTSLIDLIDSHVSFVRADFYQNTFVKIHHLLALRVWLEKQLYYLIPASDAATQKAFLDAHTLGQKIGVLLKRVPDYLSLHGISREDLMSKKVMLNQHAHFYGQVMPFAYAVNLSFDDLQKEIDELKSLFVTTPGHDLSSSL